jgi:integrase
MAVNREEYKSESITFFTFFPKFPGFFPRRDVKITLSSWNGSKCPTEFLEWRSMILFGLYSGQRLGDIAKLTWANIG